MSAQQIKYLTPERVAVLLDQKKRVISELQRTDAHYAKHGFNGMVKESINKFQLQVDALEAVQAAMEGDQSLLETL